jgi:hypothetical protein
MNRLPVALAVVIALLPFTVDAHVGSPNVFFEGQAGPYPVHVIIKPAEVIPGLAEISVRVEARGIERVTALPIKWNAGRKGAPPPDVARLVPGETNLYNAQLWFMESGAQSVELEISGSSGIGRVTIPVDAVARRVLGMPKGLGAVLVVLGLLLVTLLLSIIGAAVRQSVLEPGLEPPPKRCWRARISMGSSAVLLVLLLWGGKRWWDAEAADYRNNRLYRPLEAVARVRAEAGQRVLRLEVTDSKFARSAPLVPDHGKLMHLFLVREPKLESFAHLHPLKLDRKTFEAVLPDLPAGMYRLYADVTYETGFSDTLTTGVDVPEKALGDTAEKSSVKQDPDDSWRVISASELKSGSRECQLSSDEFMTCVGPKDIAMNQPVTLEFAVHDASGAPLAIEPYLGMRGHLALRREDGTVFTHLHPGGSASMAAMQLSMLRTEGKIPLEVRFGAEDPLCRLAVSAADQEWLRGSGWTDPSRVSFPYAFPKPGAYRMWVQVKVKGRILTGVYDLDVISTTISHKGQSR